MRGRKCRLWVAAAVLSVASCGPRTGPKGTGAPVRGPQPGLAEAAAGEVNAATVKRTVYVPFYPYVYTEDRAHPYNLAATLYVRNTDPTTPLFITSVRLHNAAGRPVRDDVAKPLRLAPLATAEFFVGESDTSGGSAASFLVDWAAPSHVNEPVIETLMVGTLSNQGIAFTCPGRVIEHPRANLSTGSTPTPDRPKP